MDLAKLSAPRTTGGETMRPRQPERRWTLIAVTAIAMLIGAALPAAAQPTCSDVGLDVEVHGQHVVRDYVVGDHDLDAWPPSGGVVGDAVAGQGAAVPGGPGPAFHFANDIPPGASFCNEQARSPGSPGPR
jgi:hypothetical protein